MSPDAEPLAGSHSTGLLRIFVTEHDRTQGHPLYEWIILQAQRAGLRGATAVRGIMGFGPHRQTIHSFKIEHLALDLPIIIEMIDDHERLRAFLAEIRPDLPTGLLITLQSVEVLPATPPAPA